MAVTLVACCSSLHLGGSIGVLLAFPKTLGKGVTGWPAQAWGKADGLQGWGDRGAATTA